MYNFDRVFNFGKKETLSPEAALRKLYESDDEIAFMVDSYLKKREQAVAFGDVTTDDRQLLLRTEHELIDALKEQGITVTDEVLGQFLETF